MLIGASLLLLGLACLTFSVGRAIQALLGLSTNQNLLAISSVIGFSAINLTILLLFKCGASLLAASEAALVMFFILAVVQWRHVASARLTWSEVPAVGISFVFAGLVLAAFAPLMIGHGTVYAPPQIGDLPKHLLAVVSLQHATYWAPPNPMFPSADFAYNYLFYVFPAVFNKIFGSHLLHFYFFPMLVAWTAFISVLAIVEVAVDLGVPRSLGFIPALLASFSGGYQSFFVPDRPALGFHIAINHLIEGMLWAEDPYIYSIYIPQHMYACIAIMISLWIMIRFGTVLSMYCSSMLSLSACLASFLLVVQANVVLLIGVSTVILRYKSLSIRMVLVIALCLFCYGAAVAPFILEARAWAPPDAPSWVRLPRGIASSPNLFLVVVFGASSLFGLIGAARSLYYFRSEPKAAVFAVTLIILWGLLLSLEYPDAALKGAALVRVFLPATASIAVVWLWNLPRKIPIQIVARTAMIAVIVIPIITSVSIFTFFTTRRRLDDSTSLGMQMLQKGVGPVLIDGSYQFEAALSGRMVTMDFSELRPDSYLPPADRNRAQAYFSKLATNDGPALDAAAQQYSMILSSANRAEVWASRLGAPAVRFDAKALFIGKHQ